MEFRTILHPEPSPFSISHKHRLLGIGSCFVENIGTMLQEHAFNLVLNPTGITYNPVSIAKALQFLIGHRQFTANDLFSHKEKWHNPDFHSRYSGPDQGEVLEGINQSIRQAAEQLSQLDYLILTLGTAHAFRHRESQEIVNNCHRLPNADFERILLTPRQIAETLSPVFSKIKDINPAVQLVITVSPVRYLRDGLVNSNRSKAHLLTAVHQLCASLPFVHYYPAYELLIDDLRDYRFFTKDMAHPEPTAIEYIWNHFQQTFCIPETRELIRKIARIKKAMRHRPSSVLSEAHQQFKQKLREEILQLTKEHPHLNLSKELELLSN